MNAGTILLYLARMGILAAVRVSFCTGAISITCISGNYYEDLNDCIEGELV